MSKKFLIMVTLLIISVFLLTPMLATAADSLFVYCGAGMRKPMEEIGALYQKQFGTKIEYQYNGSGTLLNQIITVKKGDLYFPGDVSFINKLKESQENGDMVNYIYNSVSVAYHVPVIITPAANSAGVTKLKDLSKKGIRVVIGSNSAAIGRTTENILKDNNLFQKVEPNILSRMGTVNQVALAVVMGQADAGVVWQANYFEYRDKLAVFHIPEEQNVIKDLSLAVLNLSEKKEEAERFMNFVIRPESRDIFKKYGYRVAVTPGDGS